ncbi:phosphopantetheine-binding protein [Phycisphaerales bacterium AB-hyl4]|uniref:Phosphopantetheine-binding protein n=1 Tax=Natronomicrosphaera hydrolytica TaxID=3242702 RepID=A0ABV4U2W7_9BACT
MTEAHLKSELGERVRTILRRDLRLGPDAKIEDDTPLMGGDFELDSLDMVMLVTSVEKEFGVKLTDADKGPQAFKNVGTLVAFLQNHDQIGDGSGGEATTAASASDGPASGDARPVDLEQRLAGLPHGEPFRFVSRLTELTPMEQGQGEWQLTGDESFFAGHFPQRPIVPGVLISEALAQLSGLVGVEADGEARDGQLAHVDVRFRRAVAPPATLVLHSRLTGTVDPMQHFEVRAEVDGEVVAEGRVALKRGASQG